MKQGRKKLFAMMPNENFPLQYISVPPKKHREVINIVRLKFDTEAHQIHKQITLLYIPRKKKSKNKTNERREFSSYKLVCKFSYMFVDLIIMAQCYCINKCACHKYFFSYQVMMCIVEIIKPGK